MECVGLPGSGTDSDENASAILSLEKGAKGDVAIKPSSISYVAPRRIPIPRPEPNDDARLESMEHRPGRAERDSNFRHRASRHAPWSKPLRFFIDGEDQRHYLRLLGPFAR
jgi:hypothetical protein